MDDDLLDEDFDDKVYAALSKKLMPEIRLDEPVGLDRIVGSVVLVFLGLVGVMSLVDAYSMRQYNVPVIQFKL